MKERERERDNVISAHTSTYRWVHTTSPLISEANFFISALAVPLTSQDVNGMVIEANFFSKFANQLENNCFNRCFNIAATKIYHFDGR